MTDGQVAHLATEGDDVAQCEIDQISYNSLGQNADFNFIQTRNAQSMNARSG